MLYDIVNTKRALLNITPGDSLPHYFICSVLHLLRQLKHVRNALLWRSHEHSVSQVEDVLLVSSLGHCISDSSLNRILRRRKPAIIDRRGVGLKEARNLNLLIGPGKQTRRASATHSHARRRGWWGPHCPAG